MYDSKNFFIKLTKKIISKKLKDIIKITKVKNSITKFIFKNIIKTINKYGKKKKSNSILKKRILLKH